MSSFNDIKKVNYTDNRDSIVALKEYILLKDEVSKKQLLVFKFQNNLNQKLSKMTFNVMQYDSEKFMIKKSTINYEDFTVDRGEAFVPKLKMEVDIFCETIEIELTYAKFERVEFIDGVLKPILYTHSEFISNKEEKPKPSKKEQKLLEKQRIKELKKNSKETDKRRIEVSDVTNRNKPRASAVFTILLSLCLIVFVAITVAYMGLNTKQFNIGDYMYEKIDDSSAVIRKYYGKDSNVTIDEKVDDYNIIAIDNKAFKNTNITSITFTSPISIGSYAFEGCKQLSSIENTQFINEIGNCAFKGCISLTKYESNDTSSIGVSAFENCSSLTQVNTPNATINDEAFKNDLNLKKLVIKDTNTTIFSSLFGDENNLTDLKIYRKKIQSGYFSNMKKLKNLEFGYTPNIDFGALADTNLDNYYINDSVETLNGKIIAIKLDDRGLITLPKSITDKTQAFEFLSSYKMSIKAIQTEMTIAINSDDLSMFENLKGFGILNNGLVDKYIISSNNNVDTIYWDSTSSIANKIQLPHSVNTIYYGLYSKEKKIINNQFINLDDYDIDSIYISNIKQIIGGSFECLKCISYLEIDNYGDIDLYDLGINTSLTNLVVKDTVNKKLSILVDGYNNLNNITFPNNITDLNAVIRDCSNLYTIVIPENVTTIGDRFLSNSGVSNIIFNQKLSSIGNFFIDSCDGIQTIEFPNSLKSIGNYAFSDCQNLYYINLPNGLQQIGSRIVNSNINLSDLRIPNTVTNMTMPLIGNDCSVSVVYTPFIGTNASSSVNYNAFNYSATTTYQLYVYGNLKINQSFFSNLTNLNTFAVDGEVIGLGSNVFRYSTNLWNIKFKGDFSCKFSELFNGITSLGDVVIAGNFDLGEEFFNNMSIEDLSINTYKNIFVETFTGSTIHNLFLGKNGSQDKFSIPAFYDKTLLCVNNLFLAIDLPEEASDYSDYVRKTTYTDFIRNYTIFS